MFEDEQSRLLVPSLANGYLYDHPDCAFTDLAAVRRYLDGRDIEIIAGDIARTCRRLEEEDLVLTFIDTDPRWFCLHDTGVFYRQETGR